MLLHADIQRKCTKKYAGNIAIYIVRLKGISHELVQIIWKNCGVRRGIDTPLQISGDRLNAGEDTDDQSQKDSEHENSASWGVGRY
jgi:hypothetical protein